MAKHFGDDNDSPDWGLFVDEQRRDLTARKSIKVKLPIRQHIKLHALKLFSENNISQTVEVALDMYFDRMRQHELATRLAASDTGVGEGGATGSAGAAAEGAAVAAGSGGPSRGPSGPPGPAGPAG